MKLRRLLTKRDLCRIFGLFSAKTDLFYYKTLREQVMTDEVLDRLEISPERYSSIRGPKTFFYPESLRIIRYFNIERKQNRSHCRALIGRMPNDGLIFRVKYAKNTFAMDVVAA